MEPPKMRKIFLLAALTASLGMTACNTISGAGQDVEAAGEAVSSTAEDAKN
jgi:entericidin B